MMRWRTGGGGSAPGTASSAAANGDSGGQEQSSNAHASTSSPSSSERESQDPKGGVHGADGGSKSDLPLVAGTGLNHDEDNGGTNVPLDPKAASSLHDESSTNGPGYGGRRGPAVGSRPGGGDLGPPGNGNDGGAGPPPSAPLLATAPKSSSGTTTAAASTYIKRKSAAKRSRSEASAEAIAVRAAVADKANRDTAYLADVDDDDEDGGGPSDDDDDVEDVEDDGYDHSLPADESAGPSPSASWKPQSHQSTCEFTHTITQYSQKRESGCKKAEYSATTVDSCGNRWRLIVYVNGNGRASNHHLSLFLQVADADDLPFGWNKAVSYVLTLEHPRGPTLGYAKRNPDKTFKLCPKAIDWGWSQFITSDRIQQEGYVSNDSLTVRASVTVKSSSVSIDPEDAELYLKCAVEEGNPDAVQACLAQDAGVNCQFKDDLYTPLHTACSSSTSTGSLEVLRLLLRKGADVNACNKWRETPLLIAANNGHRAAVEALLDAGADPSLCSEAGWSALTFAAHKGYDDIVTLLLAAGAPVNCRVTEDLSTPLHKACAGGKTGHISAVRQLLVGGADVHALNKWRETPLLTAANHGQAAAVEALLQHGADPCKCTDTGWSPLSIAAYKGHDDVVRLLLEEGAPTEEADPTLSALLQAATKGLPDTVMLLLRHGADHTVTTKKGDTALSILVEQNLIDAAVEMVTEFSASVPRCSRDRKKVQRARLLINLRVKQQQRDGTGGHHGKYQHDGSGSGGDDGDDSEQDSSDEGASASALHEAASPSGALTKKGSKKKGKKSKGGSGDKSIAAAEAEARAAEEALLLELDAEEHRAQQQTKVESAAGAKKKKKKQRERERQKKLREEKEAKEREEKEAKELEAKKRDRERLEKERLEKEQREREEREAAEKELRKRREREEREARQREQERRDAERRERLEKKATEANRSQLAAAKAAAVASSATPGKKEKGGASKGKGAKGKQQQQPLPPPQPDALRSAAAQPQPKAATTPSLAPAKKRGWEVQAPVVPAPIPVPPPPPPQQQQQQPAPAKAPVKVNVAKPATPEPAPIKVAKPAPAKVAPAPVAARSVEPPTSPRPAAPAPSAPPPAPFSPQSQNDQQKPPPSPLPPGQMAPMAPFSVEDQLADMANDVVASLGFDPGMGGAAVPPQKQQQQQQGGFPTQAYGAGGPDRNAGTSAPKPALQEPQPQHQQQQQQQQRQNLPEASGGVSQVDLGEASTQPSPPAVELPSVSLFRQEKLAELFRRCSMARSVPPTAQRDPLGGIDEQTVRTVAYRWIVRAVHGTSPFLDPIIPSWTDADYLTAFLQRQFISESRRGLDMSGRGGVGISIEALRDAGAAMSSLCQALAKDVVDFREKCDQQVPPDWSDAAINMTCTEMMGNGGGPPIIVIDWAGRSQVYIPSVTFSTLQQRYRGARSKFLTAIFAAAKRREATKMIVAGTGMDYRLSPSTLNSLSREIKVSVELWTDSLSVFGGNSFCGIAPDVDAAFGGLPAFGKEEGGSEEELAKHGGSMAVLPPLESATASLYIKKMLDMFEVAESNATPLSFAVVLRADCFLNVSSSPTPNDLPALDPRLGNGHSAYVLCVETLRAGQHTFHCGDGDGVVDISQTGSLLLLMQNEPGRARFPVNANSILNVVRSMEPNYVPASDQPQTVPAPAVYQVQDFAPENYPMQHHAQPVMAGGAPEYVSGDTLPTNAFGASNDNRRAGGRRGRLFDLVDDGEDDNGDVDVVSGMLNSLNVGMFQGGSSEDVDIEAISLLGIGGPTLNSAASGSRNVGRFG